MSLRSEILAHLRTCAEPANLKDLVIALGERDGTRISTELTNMVALQVLRRHHSPQGLSYSLGAESGKAGTISVSNERQPYVHPDAMESVAERTTAPVVVATAPSSLRDRVLDALRVAPAPLSNAELRSATGGGMQHVANVLQALYRKRVISKCGEMPNIVWTTRERAVELQATAERAQSTEQVVAPIAETAVAATEMQRVVDSYAASQQELGNHLASKKPFVYSLSKHVSATVADLDDLLVDAIKAKTCSEILQLLLCARSNFERAQFLATQVEQKA